ncbi:MAG: AAA family ATPase [Magnetococcales bacterium]|nr:AAA family ATPase [Magnetococcales bacterium]
MEKLIVKNFGPLKDVELDIRDCMVFIGPQASGKSTLSKLVYFFKQLKEVLSKRFEIATAQPELAHQTPQDFFIKAITSLYGIFPDSYFNAHDDLEIKYINGEYSIVIRSDVEGIIIESESIATKYVWPIFSFNSRDLPSARIQPKKEFLPVNMGDKQLVSNWKTADEIFGDVMTFQFIPDSRAAAVTLFPLGLEDDHKLDSVYRIWDMQYDEEYSQSILWEGDHGPLIKGILKGEFRDCEERGKRILFDGGGSIDLKDASSGQKEVLWVLFALSKFICRHYNINMLFIEEPEAHLFPDAQYTLVELFALYLNTNRNRLFITTHSPYILTSLNNFLQAHVVGQKNPEGVEKIRGFKRNRWIDPERVGAYFVENGEVRDIMDRELGMIHAEEIDSASVRINRDYEALMESWS